MLSKDDVLAVAKLSRLKLTDPQIEKFKGQLSNVLELFNEVNEINTDGISETSQITGLKNITRLDVVFYDNDLRPDDTDDLLRNTPIKEKTNIVVPKVIDSK